MTPTLRAHIEVKHNNKWLHYAAPIVEPNQILFAAINGEGLEYLNQTLQDHIIPQASITEIPENISDITAICLQQDQERATLYGQIKGKGVLTSEDIHNLQQHLYQLDEKLDLGYYQLFDLEEGVFHTCIDETSISKHNNFKDSRIVFWYYE